MLAPALNSYPQRNPPTPRLSLALHDAVLWPQGLEAVLNAGAEVDALNAFAKTPLMAAAHMNRPDSVRVLLLHGANINARTDAEFHECGYSILRGSRTALMYAAENAGPETLELLLDAGADPASRDSRGNGVEFYLARNPRFAPLQAGTSIAALVSAAPSSDAPSFQCSSRLGRVEAAICGDEILRMYDREIAAAYRKLLQRDSRTIQAEQRAWLTGRNSCAREREIVGCLQDALLARSRYLLAMLEADERQ